MPGTEARPLVAQAIRDVGAIRDSRDPVVVGPPPAHRAKRADWEQRRSRRFAPLERDLNELFTSVQRNHAPELVGEPWPLRMVACLTAAERYFDQRWLTGNKAPNRELAEAQWEAFHRAAEEVCVNVPARAVIHAMGSV